MGSKQGEYGYKDHHLQPYVAQPVYLDAPSAPPVQAHEVIPQPYTGQGVQQVQHVIGVTVITQPQELSGPQRGELAAAPPTYCCLAWFSCLLCCCPIGLFAVFMSMAVSDRMSRRDFEGAYQASETARKAALAAILIGACIQIISYVYEVQAASDSGDDSGNSRSN